MISRKLKFLVEMGYPYLRGNKSLCFNIELNHLDIIKYLIKHGYYRYANAFLLNSLQNNNHFLAKKMIIILVSILIWVLLFH